jgi:hypothetical protein
MMSSRAIKYTLGILFVILLVSPLQGQESNYYYTCSYKEPFEDGTDILIKKYDLDSKRVIDSASVAIRGELSFRSSIKLVSPHGDYFVVMADFGLYGKNTKIASQQEVNYAILGDNLELLSLGRLDGAFILGLVDSDTVNPIIDFRQNIHDSIREIRCELHLDGRNITLQNQRQMSFGQDDYPEIGGYSGYTRINYRNLHLYWAVTDNGVYILNIDQNAHRLRSSRDIQVTDEYSYLFGLYSDSLIYSFVINSANSDNGDTLTRPSFARVFRGIDLSLLDSISIPMPPFQIGYVANEYGACDIIGPYLVYYYFGSESYKYFSPAMLFVFDTRTNETTWLRVGWR